MKIGVSLMVASMIASAPVVCEEGDVAPVVRSKPTPQLFMVTPWKVQPGNV